MWLFDKCELLECNVLFRDRFGVRRTSPSVVFFQAEDGIRDLVRSRGLGDVYKRQAFQRRQQRHAVIEAVHRPPLTLAEALHRGIRVDTCLLYTSDAADERSSVDLGGRRIIKQKKKKKKKKRQDTSYEVRRYKNSADKVLISTVIYTRATYTV